MKNHNRSQLTSFQHQTGWTFWSMLFVMSVVLFFSYIGMQLVPIYAANDNVKNAMQRSIEEEDPRKVNRSYVIKKMQDQLYLDGSHKVLNYGTDLTVKRSRTKLTVNIQYQREIPLFYNLSIVAKFDNTVEKLLARRN